MPPEHVVAFGPGRANLIGEHTDYNDGLSLPFALEQGVRVEASATGGSEIEVEALDPGEGDRFAVAADPARADGWRAFVRGTVAELTASGVAVPGARIAFSGTVPEGAGLSSSAALEVALCLALLALADAPEPPRVELAKLCSRVENDWVGARTGLLDQLASLYGEAGHALRIDFRSLGVAPVALATGGWRLVTLDSGETHSLAESGYNERRAECDRARDELGLGSLRDATEAQAGTLTDPLGRRVRHVIGENARVDATVEALRGHDLAAVGRLLDASHASLRDLYDASTDAVEETVRRLRDAGAAGARMMGGGFGGNVLALMPPGTEAPEGAVVVEPSAGARLL